MWKYKINGLPNVFHIHEWPSYADWMKLCMKGNVQELNNFHNKYLMDMNRQLRLESFLARVECTRFAS